MEEFRIGILGAGHIAEKMAHTVAAMDGVRIYAVASRSIEKASEFAGRFGIGKAYGSYEEMVADPLVEMVYVATPHSYHYQHVRLCLEHRRKDESEETEPQQQEMEQEQSDDDSSDDSMDERRDQDHEQQQQDDGNEQGPETSEDSNQDEHPDDGQAGL